MPLAALLLLALAAPAPRPGPGSGARVEVLQGRAILAGSGVVVRMQEGDPQRWIDGPAHLELTIGSRVRVTWSGRASVLLEGRNVLEWRPADGGTPPSWDLAEVGAAHLELRRGPLDLALAGGWGARLQSGACALRGRPGDGVELDHQAGLPFDLWPPQRGEAPSVPFTVLAGARLRLVAGAGRPLTLQGSQASLRSPHQHLGFERERQARGYPAWRGFSWPWSSGVPTLAIEANAGGAAVLPGQPDLPERVQRRAPVPSRAQQIAPARRPEPTPPRQPGPEAARPAPEGADAAAPEAEASGAEAGAPPAGAGDAAEEAGDLQGPTSKPAEQPAAQPAALRPARPVREHGVLVLTPYGPRWLDASRAVDPELRRLQAERRARER